MKGWNPEKENFYADQGMTYSGRTQEEDEVTKYVEITDGRRANPTRHEARLLFKTHGWQS